jgi:beta-glucosidase-like glycosyl hydrolase
VRDDGLAGLLVPELRWDRDHGFDYLRDAIDDALELGVGGFVISGGGTDAVGALTQDLHRRSRHPLLIAADVEAGVGAQFAGATGLPPNGALGALRDAEAIRRAARLTAREARAIGINWLLAPVCDLDNEPHNPFIGSRGFGENAQRVAEWVVEWIDTAQGEGVLACAKHFPGVGRATSDPLLSVSHVDENAGVIWAEDLLPFRAAVDTGVASLLASHVVFPRLDGSGSPASRSHPLLVELLRDELHFEGLIVSDALSMGGALFGTDEGTAAVDALAAGCDLLLAPSDLAGVAEALELARDEGRVDVDAAAASRARRAFWATWGEPSGRKAPRREPTLDDVLWARQAADTVVHAIRGVSPNIGPVVDVIQVVDAGAGAVASASSSAATSGSPVGTHFIETLRAVGLSPRLVDRPTDEARGAVVIAVYGEPRAGRGRAGYGDVTRRRVAQAVADARQAGRQSVVLVFGHPRLAAELPEATNVVCCWAGSRAMQAAAARRLAN